MDMSMPVCLDVAVCDGDIRAVRDAHGDSGQGPALRACLEANYARLHRRLLQHLGCSDLASDCLHDAWLRLGGMTVSAVVHSPEAYVYRVACNIATDRLRSNRLWQDAGDADPELDSFADPAPGPEAVAALRSDIQAVDRALQLLPYRHQHILTALRVDERTRDEVAAAYGISLRRVDTILRQALDVCTGKTTPPLSRRLAAQRRGPDTAW